MIYVQEKSIARQIAALTELATGRDLVAVVWLFSRKAIPDTSAFALQPDDRKYHMPIGFIDATSGLARRTQPMPFEQFRLHAIGPADPLIRVCDSIALHERGRPEWYACLVPHENHHVCLCKDDARLQQLLASGFAASLDQPAGY